MLSPGRESTDPIVLKNEDGTPVLLRIVDLDIVGKTFRYAGRSRQASIRTLHSILGDRTTAVKGKASILYDSILFQPSCP